MLVLAGDIFYLRIELRLWRNYGNGHRKTTDKFWWFLAITSITTIVMWWNMVCNGLECSRRMLGTTRIGLFVLMIQTLSWLHYGHVSILLMNTSYGEGWTTFAKSSLMESCFKYKSSTIYIKSVLISSVKVSGKAPQNNSHIFSFQTQIYQIKQPININIKSKSYNNSGHLIRDGALCKPLQYKQIWYQKNLIKLTDFF